MCMSAISRAYFLPKLPSRASRRGSVSSYQSHRPLPTTKSVHFPGLGILPRLTRSIIHGKNHRPTAPAVADPERLVIPYGHMLDLGSVRVYNDADLWRTCVMPFDDLDFLTRVAKAYEVGKRPKWRPDIQLLNHISFQSDRKGDILDDIHVSNIFPAILILLAYGACHAAAWNTHFPSPVERLLWRISSVVIAVVPAYALFLVTLDNGDHDTLWNILTLFMFKMLNLFDGVGRVHIMGINLNIREIYKRTFSVLVFTPLFIICLAVPVGRLYLFIESFLSLRSLPYGSFDSTPWEDYFPHF
ncbi:hypothetical protein P167DRAFT_530476 [Morchella conica CCBAS932]|uniref:Uncharacterized protein n=1 Tax=Morchella conica CCBAS932 TaxID=1392247 RepID=A0A3N4K8U3_9PEZI|nr:hypothetical protein P167DRAFT_530476 [Morchella conica CCBAS932]